MITPHEPRILHRQVQATSGYARGLFQDEELDARKLQVCVHPLAW